MPSRPTSRKLAFAALVTIASIPSFTQAVNVTWDNGFGDMKWNTTSTNWAGAAWNNAAANSAVFDVNNFFPTYPTIDIDQNVNVNSIAFTNSLSVPSANYTVSGTGSINFVQGAVTSLTLGAGQLSVPTGFNVDLSNGITTNVGFQKVGGGTLVLSTPLVNTGGGINLTGNPGQLVADVVVGAPQAGVAGGALKLNAGATLAASTRLGIGSGYLDIGAASLTLASLTYCNTNDNTTWDTVLNACNGIVGTGTLHVTGDIIVTGQISSNRGFGLDSLAVPLDLDNSEQVFRTGQVNAVGESLYVTAPISNGSLTLTAGLNGNGAIGGTSGVVFTANNTYTGSTIVNLPNCSETGSNASTSLKLTGNASMTLRGADGAFGSAETIQIQSSSSLILNSNGSTTFAGVPSLPAATNNNRISDTATVALRDSNLTLTSQAATPVTETFGNLNLSAGSNSITLSPTGTIGSSATLTAAGDLTLGSRAVLFVRTAGAGTLGNNAKFIVSGTKPAAETTGIFSRVLGTSDLLIYDNTNGFIPLSAGSYSTTLAAGTNVSLGAGSASVGTSVAINALKRTAAGSIAIATGNTLTIDSGVILNTTGTGTITGGTLAFGAKPGILVGANFIDSAVTGSAGVIHTSGTGTLAGNLSGLTGSATIQGGTLHLKSTTFAGDIEVRGGATYAAYNQATAGAVGTVYLGASENDDDLSSSVPTLDYSTAGAGAIIKHNIVIDNGGQAARGLALSGSNFTKFTPLSNAVTGGGTQTLSGNITLNSPVNLQGGGGGTGATVLSGLVSGPGLFRLTNGNVIFSGTLTADGGIQAGNLGNSTSLQFVGTSTSTGTVSFVGGNTTGVNNGSVPAFLAYKHGAMPTGTLTFLSGTGTVAPRIRPLNDSTINNWIDIQSELLAEVGSGITAEWAGTVAGAGTFSKIGAGTLVLSGNDIYTGPTNITGGTLAITSTGSVSSGNVLIDGGVLNVAGKTSTYSTAAGQTIATGASGGAIVGNFIHDEGTLSPGGAASVGTLNATGAFDISGGSILYTTTNSLSVADLINVTGTTDASGSASVTLNTVNGVANGAYTLLTASGGVTGDVSGWTVDNSPLSPGSTAGVAIVGNSIVLNLGLTPRSPLSWAGTGGSAWDVATTSAWYNPGLPGADKFYLADAVNFGDTYDGVNAPVTTSITLNSLVVPSSVTANSSLDYSIAGTGTIAGPTSLIKSGTGNLTLTNNNTFTGGTTINSGTVTIGSAGTVLLTAVGTGSVILNGGALAGTSAGLNGSTGTLSMPIQVNAPGGTINFTSPATAEGTLNIAGSLTGTGSLHLMSTGTEHFNVRGVNTGFNGSVVVDGSNAIVRFITPASASATTSYELNSGTLCVDVGSLSQTISLGSLKGAAGTTLRGHWSFNTGANHTLEIGALNTSTVFAGTIIDGRQGNTSGTFRPTLIKKVGNGTLTLTGTNTYTGATTVQAGVLELGPNAHAPVLTGGGAILNGGKLLMNYTGTSPQAAIVADLTANATTGFLAGKVRTTNTLDNTKAIGWLDNGSTFSAKYTYKGDIDLDGAVTSIDFNAFVAGYGTTTGATWGQGDNNYDGKVNTTDFNYLAGNFGGAPIPAPVAASDLGSVVPEPASLGLIACGVAMSMRRRRSR
jgi:autotransporter-associated beta strand protein